MPRRRFPNDRRNSNNPENEGSKGVFSEYIEEATEDLRDEREERGAYRDSYYREEAEDRRTDRNIRGDRYYEIDREELLDERDDRRQEREIGDRVRLERTAFLGGVFANKEDRAFRRIMEREVREGKLGQYQQLIQQCQDRTKEHHMMEDWLDDIRRSDFNTDTIEEVRTEVREQKLQLLTRRSQNELLTERSNRNAEERKILKSLTDLTVFEESVYDDVLIACDTAELKNLESALETVRFCEAQAGDVLKTIPRLAAGQKRNYDNSEALQSILQVGLTGAKYAGLVAPVTFIGACVAGDGFFNVGQGFSAAILTVMIGGAVGGAIGYFKWKEGK